MRFSVCQESHIGGRRNNQDRMGYSFTRDALLLVLADGMGGHLQGEMAATIALRTIGALFRQQAQPSVRNPEQFLEESFLAAHREIHRYREINDLPETPCTTIVACVVQHDTAFWAHCGDSRLYWMRDGQVLARTRDHSRVEMLIAQGKADPSERATHPERNRLFNCLGGPIPPVVALSRRASLAAGDVLLLCSDGLWAALPEQELVQSFGKAQVGRAVPALIRAAVAQGGKYGDNVTALAVAWESAGESGDAGTSIATDALPAGSITSTIEELPQADAFHHSEIGKAIAEIRGALGRAVKLLSRN